MNYSLKTELINKIGPLVNDEKYKMILKYLEPTIKGVSIKPGTLTTSEEGYGTKHTAYSDKNVVEIIRQSNEHASISLSGKNKMSRVHFNSRLNSVEVDGFFAGNDGNYYVEQGVIQKIVKKGKSNEQIEKEVEEEMPGALRTEQLTEIRRRMDSEGKDVTKSVLTAKIYFYNLESIGYLEDPQVANQPNTRNVNYYFNQMGIEPTQVIEFEVGEGLDMVSFINDFYNHPDRYTSMLIQNEEQTL